jgi:pilus assembly protein CpaE
MLDALSLKNTKLGLETLALMGYDDERIKVVLNRADSRVGVTAEDVAVLLGRAADIRVPSHRDITRSVNEASPIVISGTDGEARRAFEALAAAYVVRDASEPNTEVPRRPKRRSLFRRRRTGS